MALRDTMDKVYFLSFLSSHVNYLILSDAGNFGDGGAWCFVLLTGNYYQKNTISQFVISKYVYLNIA